jgi:hypothetical protein
VTNTTITEVDFKLTPISGDSDLYVSRGNPHPNNTSFEKSSKELTSIMDRVAFFKGVDGNSLVGTYHAAVYGVTQSTFSILANQQIPERNSTIQLVPGKAQQDVLKKGDDTDF